jgi:hypothetical protein
VPDQAANASIVADSSVTAQGSLPFEGIALFPADSLLLAHGRVSRGVDSSIGADSTLIDSAIANYQVSSAIVASSSSSMSTGNNYQAIANMVGGSLVQANGYIQSHPHVSVVGSATLSPNPIGDYKGNTLHIMATALMSPSASAHYQGPAESIEADSTFTTWVIIIVLGEGFGGAGDITGSAIRVLDASGSFSGHGTLEMPPMAGLAIEADSSLLASVVVSRGAHASLDVVGSSTTFSAPHAHRGVSSSMFAGSLLSPPGTGIADIEASSSVQAAPRVQRVVSASFALAGATMVAHGTAVRGVHASVSTGASLSITPHLDRGVHAAIVAGPPLVSVPTQVHHDVSASIFGDSFIPPPDFSHWFADSSFSANANVSHNIPINPGVVQTIILGAQMVGAGTLQDRLLITLEGVLNGAGSIAGTANQIFGARPLPLIGAGSLHDSLPLPMFGFGTLQGFFDVQRIPRPFCPPRILKTFRYGYILTRGDLELRVCDASGNPYAPVVVLYAFYQIVPGGQRMLVGPPNRRPAVDNSQGKVGRYYATGTAGELGQPGEWVVVWRFQRSWWTPTETLEEHFKVVDEVTSGDPGAGYGRRCKYGWL